MAALGDRLVARAPYAFLIAILAWVTVHTWRPLRDPDSWWNLRLGEDFIHQGSLHAPTHWSVFATVSWTPSEPLPEVAMAFVYRAFGLPGVVWAYVATAMAIVVLVFLSCRRTSAPLPSAVATVLFVAVAEGSLTPRPQLVSFALLLVVLAAWLRTERDFRPRWWLVPLSWFWSLCHGFWFIGVGYGALAVVAIVLGRRADRKQLSRVGLVAMGSFLIVLLNPVGLGVFEAPFEVSSTASYVTEWQRPSLLSGPSLTATLMVVVVAALWAARRAPTTWLRVLLLLSGLVWAWYAQRTVVVGALVVTPLFAEALQQLVGDADAGREPGIGSREQTTIAGAVAVALVAVAFVVPHTAARPGSVPLGLDPALDRLPAGTRVFNAYQLGGWIRWRHPDLEQYIDGLVTPYSERHVREYVDAQNTAPGWERIVEESQAPAALLQESSPLAHALAGHGWVTQGTDAGYVLLTRPGWRR